MNERYTRLYDLKNYLFGENVPAMVTAGALTKDNTKNQYFIQLRMQNIVNKNIKALTVKIQLQDTAMRDICEPLIYQYLDLNVKHGDEWGEKEAIFISLVEARRFCLKIIDCIFEDGTVWHNEDIELFPIEIYDVKKIFDDENLVKQFEKQYGKKSHYIPVLLENGWICSCGVYLRSEEDVCFKCGRMKEKIVFNSSIAAEKERMQAFEHQELETLRKNNIYDEALRNFQSDDLDSVKKAKQLFQEILEWKDSENYSIQCDDKLRNLAMMIDETKKQKRKTAKVILITSAVMIVFIAVLSITVPKIRMQMQLKREYDLANSLAETEKYEEAIEKYHNLKSYEDSEERMMKCVLLYEQLSFENKDYHKCISLCEEYNHTGKEYYENSFYELGKAAYEDGTYSEAKEFLSKLSDKNRASEMLANCDIYICYDEGIQNMQNGKLQEAIESFSKTNGYGRTNEYIAKCKECMEFSGEYICVSTILKNSTVRDWPVLSDPFKVISKIDKDLNASISLKYKDFAYTENAIREFNYQGNKVNGIISWEQEGYENTFNLATMTRTETINSSVYVSTYKKNK